MSQLTEEEKEDYRKNRNILVEWKISENKRKKEGRIRNMKLFGIENEALAQCQRIDCGETDLLQYERRNYVGGATGEPYTKFYLFCPAHRCVCVGQYFKACKTCIFSQLYTAKAIQAAKEKEKDKEAEQSPVDV